MKKIIISIVFVVFAAIGCDDATVNNSDFEYDEKIVIQGFLSPGKAVENIKLTRNNPVTNKNASSEELLPETNNVVVTINGVKLDYSPSRKYYSDRINVESHGVYVLKVTAVIDGKSLTASSTTVVPPSGFQILEENLGDIKFDVDSPDFSFTRSMNYDEFYLFSIVAQNPDTLNYIQNHPFQGQRNGKEVLDELNQLSHNLEIFSDLSNVSENLITLSVGMENTNFYTNYKLVGYAADRNYKDFVLTALDVQTTDGNFFKPVFHIEGDGIGYFGSGVIDTLYFNIVK